NIRRRVSAASPVATGGYMGDIAGYASGGTPKEFPHGGRVYGPGTSTSDDVPAWLSTSEFVQRAAAVKKYGTGFMYAVNSLRFPAELAKGSATGGQPGMQPAPMPQVLTNRSSGTMVSQTVNNYAIPADQPQEFAKATLFALRRSQRGGAYAG